MSLRPKYLHSQLEFKNTFNRENLADIHLLFPEAISANAKSERIAENRVQVSFKSTNRSITDPRGGCIW
jgi:hypothetical protein